MIRPALVLLLLLAGPASLAGAEVAPPEKKTPVKPAPAAPGPATGDKAAPDPATETKAAAPVPGSLEAHLALLDRTNRAIRTLRVPYVQERKVRISRRLRKASGLFVLEVRKAPLGARVLFQETKPHHMDLLFTETKVVFRDGATGKVDVRDPRKGGVRPSEIWVIGRPLVALKKQYVISLAERTEKEKKIYLAKLRLLPRNEKIRKWVKELYVWLRPKDALPMRTQIVSPNGAYQIFTFDATRLERNRPLPKGTFALEKAKATKSG